MASPTVKLESLILSLLIDAHENRDVATAYVVGAYLIADKKDHMIVKLTGESVDIMCQANAKYKKFVSYRNGRKVLHMKLLQLLYGCIAVCPIMV